MANRILQVNFTLAMTIQEYQELATSLADTFANLPGLLWKIWLLNEANQEAGGLYLFDSEASMAAYLDGPIVAALKSHPAITNLHVKQFDVMPDVTTVTRGPVPTGSIAS
jgi:hypothetical protein